MSLSDELLSHCAFDRPDRARAAWTQWCEAYRLDDLDPARSLILPVIWANLRGDGFNGDLANRARLEGISRHWRVRQHLLVAAADEITATMRRGGQRCALIDGAALDVLAYPHNVVRPGYHVAVLVDGRAIDQVANALAVDGWETVDGHRLGPGSLQTSSGTVIGRDNTRVTLRWDLVRGERQADLDPKELLLSQTAGDRSVIRAEAALLCLLADSQQQTDASLLWEADVRQLTRVPSLDLSEVARMARERGAIRVVRRSAALLESRGVSLGEEARCLMVGGPRRWAPSALTFDLRQRHSFPGARVASFIALTRDLPATGRARLAVQRVRSRFRRDTRLLRET